MPRPPAIAARPLRAVAFGGLIAGTLDITAALAVYGAMGARPIPLLQGIAAGLLGSRSFSGGMATAALGLVCHFVIAFGAATVYVSASRVLPFLTRFPFFSGPLYGIAVYFFMQFIVHHSGAIQRPFSLELTLIGCAIHIVCIGTPIALAARRFAST